MANKFSVVPAEAIYDDRLSPAEVRTLCVICYYGAQKDGGCWPSYGTLAERTGTSRRSIIRHVEALVSHGYIVKEKRRRNDGGSTSNVYRANYEISLENSKLLLDDAGDTADTQPNDTTDTPSVSGVSLQEQENSNRKRKNIKYSLALWEKKVGGKLCIQQLQNWVEDNQLDPKKMANLIGEFREKVTAGGNEYADFTAAFKVWLRQGYLSQKLESLRKTAPRSKHETYNMGVSL